MAKRDEAGKPPALRIDRHYDAAPEEVWRAWTEPEEMKRWWGPGKNDVVHLAEADVRVGGRASPSVHGQDPDGNSIAFAQAPDDAASK